jgi:hypothetical protein
MQLERNLDIRVGRQSGQRCPNRCQQDKDDAFNESSPSVEINESVSAELRHTLTLRNHLRITIQTKHHRHRMPYQNEDGHTLH